MNKQHQDLLWFKQCLEKKELVEQLKKIKLIIADIDGSLTDGNLEYTEEKENSRRFSTQDGFGIIKAMKAGILVAFLSGKDHGSIKARAQLLGIPDDLFIGGRKDKLVVIQQIQQKHGLSDNEVLMFGDDHFDALVKQQNPAFIFAVPNNAPFYYHDFANVVVPREGGHHAFRLLVDLILYVQKKHFDAELITQALR
ncbi:hypothetical protein K2W90_00285 [Candidatus Babeliales bacterium]|nr:hypothetical protein [Candidatus Babeliales bacterium]